MFSISFFFGFFGDIFVGLGLDINFPLAFIKSIPISP